MIDAPPGELHTCSSPGWVDSVLQDEAVRAERESDARAEAAYAKGYVDGRADDHGHPESLCGRCGGPNVRWHAPSPLWNQVMRGGSINGEWQYDEIICPTCFAVMAEDQGIATHWRMTADRVNLPLETVTPSGRVWDDTTQLWTDPPGVTT